MASDYLPGTDGGLRDWANNFSTLITANPSTYGLMASDAAAIAAQVNAYDAALTLAVDPGTKTKATVANKDSAKAAMLVVVRRYAQVIKLNDGVSNEEKITLGININDTSRTPVPAPTTKPVCTNIEADALQHILRFVDAATPTKLAKPPGALGLEIYYFVAPASTPPPVLPEPGTPFFGVATRPSCTINLNVADVGKTATYWARWIMRTGLVGPWSEPVAKMVAA